MSDHTHFRPRRFDKRFSGAPAGWPPIFPRVPPAGARTYSMIPMFLSFVCRLAPFFKYPLTAVGVPLNIANLNLSSSALIFMFSPLFAV